MIALLLVAAAVVAASSPEHVYARVYLDDHRNVRAVTTGGQDVRLTRGGRFLDPKLSPDGKTVGVRVVSRVRIDTNTSGEDVEVTPELAIYRNGKIVRRFAPGGYIRAWSFWNGGAEVGIYSGALHFAGFYVLYDLPSGKELARSEDPVNEQSPEWVRGIF